MTAPCPQSQSHPEEDDEAEEDEAEELGHAETYADYVPSKCECAVGKDPQQRPPGCTASLGLHPPARSAHPRGP